MNQHIATLENKLAPLRDRLTHHPLYATLKAVQDIQVFMEYHVFAVWDFMSLLKALQRELTCTTLPWVPKSNPTLARFINEIVWGEESDVNELGEPKSHFEMYWEAMEQVGASTAQMQQLLTQLEAGTAIFEALSLMDLPPSVDAFLRFTFELIEGQQPHQIAAAFTFGREDLIPDMFLAILREAKERDGQDTYNKLTYYLQRHIDVDGDEHGPLALQMMEELCQDDPQKWAEVQAIALDALQKRLDLWDGIHEALLSQHTTLAH